MKVYPICLIGLDQQRCLVVGGGEIAARKVEALLDANASVTVISPQLTAWLHELVDAGRVQWLGRDYQAGDVTGAFLVIAATDCPEVNQAVWQEAQAGRCLINVVDDPPHCNFILPAVVRRGELNVAISTGGASPALARRLRERLEDEIGAEYGDLAALLAELRPELMSSLPAGQARLRAALRIVDSDVLGVLRTAGRAAALAYARAELLAESQGAAEPGQGEY